MATDEFGGVAVDDEPKPKIDQFGGIAIDDTPVPSPPISGHETFLPNLVSDDAKPFVNSTTTGGIMKAFGHEFGQAFGAEQLGLSPEGTKWLSKIGIFAPEGQEKYQNPFQAFNEGVLVNTAAFLDGAIRTASGVFRGGQAATMEALGGSQFGRDIAAIPEAFMGTPHALGEIKMRSGLPKDRPVGAPLQDLSPNPIQRIDVFHGSPYSFDAFSTKHIGAGEGAQSYGHGLYFTDEPKVAEGYAERLGKGEGNVYQVKVNVDPTRMLDLDIPLNQQAPFVQSAVKQAMGIDYYGNFDEAKSDRMWSEFKGANAKTAIRQGFIATSDEAVTQRLSDAGIPGSKYLDQRSRGAGEGTRNYVVFNENDIQITHKNGEPIPTPQDKIAQAKDLGVIGPDKPMLADMKDKPAAEAVDALKPKQDGAPEVQPPTDGGWRDRFEHFVGKLTQPEEIRQLIRDSADENNNFPGARAPAEPLSLNEAQNLADAAGMDIGEVDRAKLGRQFNEAHVDRAMQVMIQATRNVKDMARSVIEDASEENLIKFQEHLLRRDMAVEEIVGIRSTWGRIGNTLNKYVTEVKDGKALDSFIKETCPL